LLLIGAVIAVSVTAYLAIRPREGRACAPRGGRWRRRCGSACRPSPCACGRRGLRGREWRWRRRPCRRRLRAGHRHRIVPAGRWRHPLLPWRANPPKSGPCASPLLLC